MAGMISKGLAAAKKNPWSTAFNVGLAGVSGYATYNESREKGDGVFVSGLKAASEAAYYGVAGWWAVGFDAVQGAGGLIVSAAESANQHLRMYERDMRDQTPFRNYTFVDGPQIYTMRQAGMALAQKSKYQLQQTMMGNEAQYMHR